LIVQIYDHRSVATTSRNPPVASGSNKGNAPFSIHGYNNFITPSPYVPFPSQNPNPGQEQDVAQSNGKGQDGLGANGNRKADSEIMPAPVQPINTSATKQSNQPKLITTVLFSTPLSLHAEICILAQTPAPDSRSNRKNKDSVNSLMTNSQNSVNSPATSSLKGPPAKRQKMILDKSNVHEFESLVLKSTGLPLYLEPAKSFAESLMIMDALKDPLHNAARPAAKTRKRTVAELAADEALAAKEERFMLIMDERLAASAGATTAGAGTSAVDAQSAAGAFEPRFSRFKTLENIKMRHEENARLKEEEEANKELLKRQQAEAEALKKREQDEKLRQEQQKALLALQQEKAFHQQQQQQQQQLAQQQLAASIMQAQNQPSDAILHVPNPQYQAVSQVQHSSPLLRQQTPHSSSSPMLGNAISNSIGGIPMTATTSNQGSRSPVRPPSAAQHGMPAQVAMARQISQQHSQSSMSRAGTPQMVHATPKIGTAVPVTRHMTPQPRANQVSTANGIQLTPTAANTPQMQHSQPVSEQQLNVLRAQQIRRQQQTASMQGSQLHNLTPEQVQHIAFLRAQQAQAAAQQQNAMSGVQSPENVVMSPQNYNQHLARQMQAQMHAMGNMQNSPSGPTGANGGQGLNIMGANGNLQPNMQGMDVQTLQRAHALQRARQAHMANRQQMLQQLAAQNGGQLPPHVVAQMQQQQAHLHAMHAQAQARAAQPQMAGRGQPQMDPVTQQNYLQNMQRAKLQQQQQQQMLSQMGRGQPGVGMNGSMGMQGGQGRGMG
jgi:transcription factor SPT20